MDKIQKVASVSAESVKKHTKKDWNTWTQILNRRSCQTFTHQQLVQLLKTEFKLTPWWQQVVARSYQIAIGVRIPNQTLKGTYTTTVTKSVKISVKELFNFLLSTKGQNIWLKPLYPVKIAANQNFECEGGIFGEFRTITANKKLRLTWINEDWPQKTVVQINLYLKPGKKTMIVISHIDLPTLKAKTAMHARWRKAVDDIFAALTAENLANFQIETSCC